MRRIVAMLLAAVLLLPAFSLAEEFVYPAIFEVDYKVNERKVEDNRYFVSKEYLLSSNESVNAELRQIADDFDEQLFPQMQPDKSKNARRNSRLDIEVLHYVTGDSWLSTMVLARMSYQRNQVQSPFTTRTFDLETGSRILLTDIFPEDSAAWELMAQRVESHVSGLFPNEARNPEAVAQLTTREALEHAEFTLSGFEMTLHYEARAVYPNKAGLMHVRFFYDELWDHMTEEARRQTDNTDWKMVAITCDDGPTYAETANTLTNFRREGARATFFTVGKKVAGNPDIVMRTFDQNHVIATHTYNHWSGYSMSDAAMHKEVDDHNALLIDLTGEKVAHFRAPGGTYPPWVEADIGLPIIQWSVDTYDYTGKSARKIFYSIRNNVQDGDVILTHDSGKIMHTSIEIFAKWFRDNGYMMVTVDELAHANGVTMQPNEVYYRYLDGDTSKRSDSNT